MCFFARSTGISGRHGMLRYHGRSWPTQFVQVNKPSDWFASHDYIRIEYDNQLLVSAQIDLNVDNFVNLFII